MCHKIILMYNLPGCDNVIGIAFLILRNKLFSVYVKSGTFSLLLMMIFVAPTKRETPIYFHFLCLQIYERG